MLKLVIWLCLFTHGCSKPIPDSTSEESHDQSPTRNTAEYNDNLNKENPAPLCDRESKADLKGDNNSNNTKCVCCGDGCARGTCCEPAPGSKSSNTPCDCQSTNIRNCDNTKPCNSTCDEDTPATAPCNTRCCERTPDNDNDGEDTPNEEDDDGVEEEGDTTCDEDNNTPTDDDCNESPDEDCNLSPEEDAPCTCDENVICTKDCNPTCFHQHQHDHYHHEEPQTVTCLHQHHHHHHHHHQHHHFHYQPCCCRCNETRNNGKNENKDYICCCPQPPACCSNNNNKASNYAIKEQDGSYANKDKASSYANKEQVETQNGNSDNDLGEKVNSKNTANEFPNDDDVKDGVDDVMNKQAEFAKNNEDLKPAEFTNNNDNLTIGDTKTLVSNNSQLVDSNTNSNANKNNLSKIIFTSVSRICQFLHNKSNAYKVVHDKRCCICCCKKKRIDNDSISKRSDHGSCKCNRRCKTHHCHHHHRHHHCCACCNKKSERNTSGNSNG